MRQSESLGAANVKVRKLACTLQQDPKVISIGRIGDPKSSFVEGSIYGHGLKMLVDTGTSRTIMQPDMVNAWQVREPGRKLLLTVTTRRSMKAQQGGCHLELKLGEEVFEHIVVDSITEEIILGLDF